MRNISMNMGQNDVYWWPARRTEVLYSHKKENVSANGLKNKSDHSSLPYIHCLYKQLCDITKYVDLREQSWYTKPRTCVILVW